MVVMKGGGGAPRGVRCSSARAEGGKPPGQDRREEVTRPAAPVKSQEKRASAGAWLPAAPAV